MKASPNHNSHDMNGIIYVRVSSKEQIEGTSLESQTAACQEYAQTKSIKILKTFVERGESAKFADRTELLALIDFCKENKGSIQLLLVWKIDRFARNTNDYFNIKALLLKYGVRVVSVTEPIDDNPEGKLLETILAGFAQFDNDIRAMRTVQGMKRKLEEGIFPWKAPLGYKSSVHGDEKKTEPDVPDTSLFRLLQRAWREFATGAYTKAEMLRLMETWGLRTRTGEPLSDQSLDNLFRNRYYAGILLDPWSGEEHEGKHVPMVSREDFARVQQILAKGNQSLPHRKERPEFPLRGVVRCPTCRNYLTSGFSRGRSKRYGYYCCRNDRCGVAPSFPSDSVHNEFSAFLKQVTPHPEIVDKVGEAVLQVASERQNRGRGARDHHRAELERLERQRKELLRLKMDGLITDQEFVAEREKLANRRMALDAQLQARRVDIKTIENDLEKIKVPLTKLGATWEGLPLPKQKRFNRFLLPVGFVHGRTGTAEIGLLFRVFRGFATANSSGVPLTRKNLNQLMQEISALAGVFRSESEEELQPEGRFKEFQRNRPHGRKLNQR